MNGFFIHLKLYKGIGKRTNEQRAKTNSYLRLSIYHLLPTTFHSQLTTFSFYFPLTSLPL
ncbi:hypothetical protein Pedsa_2031 [Pseudopedobacter saltans DSM 12145]|uniref:Uncharacterized protein n=1 Tax=Pseudopedobacter saltans (strain ATCC 51119 / DSM 12145 / JCM 21818 / CCUG 39354 / LMG 10337 / NBRC 100064 / NCIMB 13643) TaxID=762903 RepID=F0SAG3_PSESL|nr:hypothetical protein Pedsa_2031 [Pseudopedobacter saltans DSM 12145]